MMAITGIATQGDEASCGRVRRFWLQYSLDGMRFELYNDPILGDVSLTSAFVQFYKLISGRSHCSPP